MRSGVRRVRKLGNRQHLSVEGLERRTLLDGGFPHGGLDHMPDFAACAARPVVESVASGLWSSPSTWSSGHVPNNETVMITEGNSVTYDLASDSPIPFLEV